MRSSKLGKSHFRFKNRDLFNHNSDLKKVDTEARLLLRQVSNATLFSSYLEKVDNDTDKTESLRALMEVFGSMTDVISRIIVNSVKSRRIAHVSEMAFKNKSTENKLLSLSTVGPNLFGGKFFDILHDSAENIRDAKETQFLRKTARSEQATSTRKRKEESDSSKDQSTDSTPISSKRRKFSNDFKSPRRNTAKAVSADKSHTKDSFPKKGKSQLGFRPQK